MSMRTDVNIEVEGLNDLIRDVKRAGGDARPLVTAALTNSATRTQSEQRRRAAHRTGTLQRSILPQVHYPTAEVEVHEKYGIFVEKGTGIYGPRHRPITPKSAKVLAFKAGGSMVFTKKVLGMKPRPFFKPGWQAAQPFIRSQFDQVTARLVAVMAGRSR